VGDEKQEIERETEGDAQPGEHQGVEDLSHAITGEKGRTDIFKMMPIIIGNTQTLILLHVMP
jgi:hypothetical protein